MALARAQANKRATTMERDQAATATALLVLLTAWFRSKAAISATQLPTEILSALTAAGFDPTAVAQAGEIVLDHPLSGRTRGGSPEAKPGLPVVRQVAAEEPEVRARYLLAATERLTEAEQAGDFDAAVRREATYAVQHVKAGQNRRAAAIRLAELAGDTDQLLVWRAVMDQRTTPDCAALNGRIFHASDPPGLPGAMHSRCRCSAETWGQPGPLINWGTAI
jgi:SPP1 gp7 family putative phage head morphogenesis protein